MPFQRLWANFFFAILIAAPLWTSAQDVPAPVLNNALQTGTIVSVQAHQEGRAFDWVGRGAIPIYDRYPFYDLTVELSGKSYTVRYESQTGYYPAAWKPGSAIQVRTARGRLYLLRYDGEEVPAGIVRRESVDHQSVDHR